MSWLTSIFCAHNFRFARNFYGDEINARGGKRSLWWCDKCGKSQARAGLWPDSYHAGEGVATPSCGGDNTGFGPGAG